jgi:hypothetical protein
MDTRTTSLAFTLALVLGLPGCGKDANTQMCLDEFEQFKTAVAAKDNKAQQLAGGIYQSCGISCDITKDAEACGAFKRVTEVMCENEGKEVCQKLCDSGKGNPDKPEKNEHACAALAAMK